MSLCDYNITAVKHLHRLSAPVSYKQEILLQECVLSLDFKGILSCFRWFWTGGENTDYCTGICLKTKTTPCGSLHIFSYLSRCLAAASSLLRSENLIWLSGPDPLVVRSTVSSCISIGTPSAENSRSSSTPVAPFLLALCETRELTESHHKSMIVSCRLIGFCCWGRQ